MRREPDAAYKPDPWSCSAKLSVLGRELGCASMEVKDAEAEVSNSKRRIRKAWKVQYSQRFFVDTDARKVAGRIIFL